MVGKVCGELGVSERRACKVLGQARATQRRPDQVSDEELRLVARVIELAAQYGRYGYRRITALLQQEGWKVNHKRVERIWRRASFPRACMGQVGWKYGTVASISS